MSELNQIVVHPASVPELLVGGKFPLPVLELGADLLNLLSEMCVFPAPEN